MRKYLDIFRNWRIMALTAVALLVITLLAADTCDIAVTATGVAVAFVWWHMYRRWKDKLPELKVFNDDDEQQA